MENEQQIEYEGNYVAIRNARMGPKFGLCGRPAAQLVRECQKYPNEIDFIKRDEKYSMRASSKSILQLLMLAAHQGSKLDILVENLPGTNPENIAKRLYNGITTDSDFNFDFDRVLKDEKPNTQ
jgi:phosphotransferase system HPr (HPr) family protein